MISRKDPVKELPPEKKFSLPPWVEENLAALGIGAIVALFGLFLLLRPEPKRVPTAKIEKVLGPLTVFAPGSDTKLDAVKVTVKNLGPEIAQKVSVTTTVMGQTYTMVGPVQIAPNSSAEYEAKGINIELAKGEVPLLFARCENC